VDAIVTAARQTEVDGITTAGSEIALRTVARAAKILALPFYADPDTVDRCQAKDRMREAYAKGGAPVPPFAAITDAKEAAAFVERHGLPVVVKPSRGWGQRGVSKIERPDELEASFARAKQASDSGVVMIESFIEGLEVSVNAYTLEGETTAYSVTERVITEYPDPPGITFAEWFPSGLSAADEKRAIEAAVAGVRALGVVRGPTYTQLRIGPRGAFIVETAHRLGGGLDPDVALLASGVSLFRKILGVALGDRSWEEFGVEAECHGGAIGKFIIAKPGLVRAVVGLAEARAMPGVVAAEAYVRPGGRVFPLTDGSKRAGHVLAFGKDRREADERARRAASVIRIETTQDSE
jgi:cysteine synthase A